MSSYKGVLMGLFAYLSSAVVVLGLTGFVSTPVKPVSVSAVEQGQPKSMSVELLKKEFESHQYHWPIADASVPPVLIKTLPRDLADVYSVKERKGLFLRVMLPIALMESERVRSQRERLDALVNKEVLSEDDRGWLAALSKEYRIKGDAFSREALDELLQRVDEIPVGLVLAQSAIESGWGTSRFAKEGNSLFGQWSYTKSDGLVPESRNEGASHVVKQFDSLQASVRSYMRNLNTHNAYRELRAIRKQLRDQQQSVTAHELADGLINYSQRREAYIEEVQAIIRVNDLDQYNHLVLEG